ncbi:MAG: tRNA(Met) cytidine acetyltransferase TmcA [Pseudomonadota bacterium]
MHADPPSSDAVVAALEAARPAWQAARHRLPVVISGSPDWVMARARALIDSDSLWIGPDAPDRTRSLSFRRAREALGAECGTLVFNALSGFDPDALGAAAGLPRAGGRLIWLTPPLADWPERDDPELERIAPYPLTHRYAGNRFLGRLASVLQKEPVVWRIAENAPLPNPPSATTPAESTAPDDPACRTQEQSEAVARIRAVARGRPRRPLVLRSHRGRGKTSALGIAAARVLAEGLGDVLVTAPRLAAVEALFERAAQQPGIQAGENGELISGGCRLRFLPPDVLLDKRPSARLLLVDEAAALPAPMLESLYGYCSRAVFATTQHGYEGTGRGFAVRFESRLDQLAVSVRRLTLTNPIRWAPEDPLESLVDRLLLLDAEPAPSESIDRNAAVKIAVVQPEALVADEGRLAELFGLLVTAHYRTTPRDLRQLLDAPGTRVWSATVGGHIVATAVTQDEGGLAAKLGEAVFAGERRVRGHLLPQTMAAHAGEPAWTGLRGRRIQRIAVHPDLRRGRLGSRLVEAIGEQTRIDGFDFVGTSFGAETDLLAFWQAQGMAILHLGQHRDHASGHQALVMARGLSHRGHSLVSESAWRFQENLPTFAAGPLRATETGLLADLLQSSPERPPAVSAEDRKRIEACAFRRHHLDAALPALRAFLPRALGLPVVRARVPRASRELLVARFLQLHDASELSTRFDLEGREAIERRIRQVLGEVMTAVGPATAEPRCHDGQPGATGGRNFHHLPSTITENRS